MSLALVAAFSVLGVVLIHHVALTLLVDRSATIRSLGRHSVGAIVAVAMAAHLIEIGFLAICWQLLLVTGSVQISVPSPSFSDVLYFAGVVYTSVGFGDLLPLGPARHLATAHAVAGLVLIAWTASHTYVEAIRVSNLVSELRPARQNRARPGW